MKTNQSITLILSIVTLFFQTGCASTGLNVATSSAVAQIAAKDATFITLQQHPEWRPQFERAYTEVAALANQNRIDVATLSGIIQRLPVKELKGTTARIVVSDVQIVIEKIVPNTGQIISQEKYADAKAVIIGIRDGMRSGLDMDKPITGFWLDGGDTGQSTGSLILTSR